MTAREDNFDNVLVPFVRGMNDALSPGGIIHERVDNIAGQVLDAPIEYRGGVFEGQATSLRAEIGWLPANLGVIVEQNNKILEQLAGVSASLQALSEKQGIDPAELERIVKEAVESSAGTYEFRKVGSE